MKNNVGMIGGIILGLTIMIAAVVILCCTERVPAGYVGVVYDMNGGVRDEVLTQGFHITSPTTKVTLYTVGLEQSYLTAEGNGDSHKDESFTASSSEGKSIKIDLTFTYQYPTENVVDVFTTFKGQSGKEVRDSFIKPNIVSWTKEAVARYKVSELLGEKRAEANLYLTDYLAEKFKDYGIAVSNVSLINIDVDEETMKAINAKITAQQNAETQSINNQTAIDKAEADAKVKLTQAQADADVVKITTEAEAERYKELSNNITPQLIQKWEMDARKAHGWVTIQGNGSTIVDAK